MATNEEKLAEAKAAYHNLLTGTSVREVVDQNGEKITYNAANRGALGLYIADLEALIAGTTVPLGPMRVYF